MKTQFGLTLNTDQFESPFNETLKDLIEKGIMLHESFRDCMRPQWKQRSLEILIVDNTELSAYAENHADYDRIYIFRGALEIIYGNIFGLLSIPTFFPAIGNVEMEVAPQNLFAGGFPRAPMLRDDSNANQPMTLFPNDQTRMTVALILAELAFEFLIFHEIGHIVGGHLEILRINQNVTTISEFEHAVNNSDNCTLNQVLECDADAFACHVTSWIHSQDKMAKLTRDVVNTSKWSSKVFALLTYLMGVGVLFRILYPKAPIKISQCNSSHPHPAVRACLVASSTMARALFDGSVTCVTLNNIMIDSIQNIENVWVAFCLPGQYPEAPTVWAQNIKYAAMELFKSYGNARTLLDQYARLPRRWDNWEWPEENKRGK